MSPLADTFDLICHAPRDWVKRPRLWRLAWGAVCLPVAAGLLASSQIALQWKAAHLGDARVAGGILIVVGLFYLVQSVWHDVLHVHRICFHPQGLQLAWSHVPHLLGPRVQQERLFLWSELRSLAWLESHHEHAFEQHLNVAFKEPIGHRRDQLKIFVSDDRNLDHCAKLIAFLPSDFKAPEWLASTRQKIKVG